MEHELFREDFMLSTLVNIFDLHWNEEEFYPILETKEGVAFGADEYEYLNFNSVLQLKLMEDDAELSCNGILFFGDGTIEFHTTDNEAFCWYLFDEESIQKVENVLRDLPKQY